ncbi:MAG: VOC family protein [Acidobacteriia bacterium]|nr:VOC family protein [Terriglobia bacterium]
MRTTTMALLLLTLLWPLAGTQGEEKMKPITVKKITPVLVVDEVEPCVKFWVERLGFEKTAGVPDGNKLAFVILQKGGTEVMYQSLASVEKDAAFNAQAYRKGTTFLYLEVENLDDIITAMKGVEVVMPVRTTFYGAREIGVKDPGGHIVTFAQFGATPQH